MFQDTPITTVAHVIQLSVAPVFLITGIGAMLTVLTNRLGRIVDRARVVENSSPNTAPTGMTPEEELRRLSLRAKLISTAISLCTFTALLVSAIIATLFLGAFFSFGVSLIVALFFVAAMLAFIAALLLFLREVFIAIEGLKFGRVTQ
ncbi:DUF2721 domain-containing protein [Imhoffiella purpurea]|uniref:DUF2721 domain-containing protein n=1 Tax=Imhoffiella purpurea TaxID=1249627 RepID=W9VAP4_9GAMM|nr:DUF2721 domain-containing protein [Imhoffiella purpurea]EXJ16514.1 hypothetical protein D779_0115 [Imhoffiella purpurea]